MSLPRLAPGVRRPTPTLLVGGSPLRVLRLSAQGADALDALLTGRPHDAAGALSRRLSVAGLLLLPPGAPQLGSVSVVVPARSGPGPVRETLAGLPPRVPVVVVDDGSAPPLELPGVQLLRSPVSRGPAAARNTGAAACRTPLIAFVDTGVRLAPGALERLSGHFTDERVVAVAPRVLSGPAPGAVGVLEQQLSALDLGSEPGEVRPGAALSYVPSAALVVRRDTFEQIGGFDTRLRVGEDVDLVWRLAERGVVRYDPEAVVRHAPRTSLLRALRRRRDYGTSAAPLDARHPHRLRHLRVSWWSALPWLSALVHPAAGPVTAAALVAQAPRRLPELPAAEARRLAAATQWAAFGAAGRYALRPAWPLTAVALAASVRVRRAAPLLLAAYLAGSWSRLRADPLVALPVRAGLCVADDLAYSAGVWRGAVGTGRWRVLLPGISRARPSSRR